MTRPFALAPATLCTLPSGDGSTCPTTRAAATASGKTCTNPASTAACNCALPGATASPCSSENDGWLPRRRDPRTSSSVSTQSGSAAGKSPPGG
eukprot:8986479-Lingulodinium_polyedra.AAC.1